MRSRIVLHARQRSPWALAEDVPWKRVGTSTSNPSGRTRVSDDSRDQNRPEPFVVVTKPLSRGPPQVAQRCSKPIAPSPSTRAEYLSFAAPGTALGRRAPPPQPLRTSGGGKGRKRVLNPSKRTSGPNRRGKNWGPCVVRAPHRVPLRHREIREERGPACLPAPPGAPVARAGHRLGRILKGQKPPWPGRLDRAVGRRGEAQNDT